MCKVYTDVGGIKYFYYVCPPVRKIIHSLKLVDYLHVQADNPRYNYYIDSVNFAYRAHLAFSSKDRPSIIEIQIFICIISSKVSAWSTHARIQEFSWGGGGGGGQVSLTKKL